MEMLWKVLDNAAILYKNGYPVKRAGNITLKEASTRELYVFSACVSWILRKQQKQFMKEFRRGVYNGVQIRRHAKGWVYNLNRGSQKMRNPFGKKNRIQTFFGAGALSANLLEEILEEIGYPDVRKFPSQPKSSIKS